MRLKILLIYLVILSTATRLFAQTTETNYFIPTPYPKSPNSAEFAKYGDYKVNLFTGLPDISIPLYTIQAGGLEVPITLSYHASGIKVAQVATWVGLGWSVSAGGTITRSIMGLPDDQSLGLLSGSFRGNVDTEAEIDSDIYYLDNVIKGLADTRPDIFSYDFPGHSGKFFFDPTNGLKPALLPFAPVKVTHTTPNNSNHFTMNFNMLDEHGNNYAFGKTYKEFTTTVTPGRAAGATSGWMLENMISQNKRDTISFSYGNQIVSSPTQTSNMDIISSNVSNNLGPYTPQFTPYNESTTIVSVGEQDPQIILFKNGKVVFELDTNKRTDINTPPYGLHDIAVYSFNFSTRTYQLLKKIVFFKTYFTNSSQPRLRLDSIQVQDAAGGTMQHYRFDYNTSITMPAYDSPGIDYWGYYNGMDISDNRVQRQSISYQPYLQAPGNIMVTVGSTTTINNRNPDSTKMQACMLTGIHYPTGGYTTFNYQTNRYIDPSTHILTLAGGLRIASIQSYDGVNPTPIIKTYQYSNAEPNFIANYSCFAYVQNHNHWASGGVFLDQTETVTSYVSNPRFDLAPYDGAPVVYPSVSEYIGTPGANIGRTDFTFRFVQDIEQYATMTGIPIVTSAFYQRGQLLNKKEFQRNSSGTYQVVRNESNTYTAFAPNLHYAVGLAVGKDVINDGAMSGPFLSSQDSIFLDDPNRYNGFRAAYYNIPSDDNYLTSTTTNIYDTNDTTKYTTSTISYKYDNIAHQQVSRTYHTDSKGSTHITTNRYPADYLNGGSTTNNAVLDTMLNHNMQAELIEKWDSVKNVTFGMNAVTGGQYNVYKYGRLGVSVVPSKISTLNVASQLSGFVPAGTAGNYTGDSHYVQMISFDNYDGQNNILQYTPRNSTPVSIIWDYQNDLPTAQIKNALNPTTNINQNVAYTSFEADGQGNWFFSGTPVSDATAPDGLNSYSLSSGPISSQNLDNTKSYVVSYWSNSGAATVNSAAGTALRSNNGWTYYEHILPAGTATILVSGTTTIDQLRLYPADAQMTTYAYDPFGLRSITDTKGQTNYFEYDPFQRLKNIKDWNGNIVKNYTYHTYDQLSPNDAMSATITRNNCPFGTTPGSTTYSVPANKYYSSTKASANAEAMYDLNVNGQNKANAVCTCAVDSVTFTLINNTTIGGFGARFTGPQNVNAAFPNPGSGPVHVTLAPGSYSIFCPSVSPFTTTYTWTLSNGTQFSSPTSVTFNSVNVNPGSTELTITIN